MKKVLKQMKVILIKDVPNLGQAGETKDVKPGFARNFLISRSLAVLFSDPKAKAILKERATKVKEIKAQETKASDALSGLADKKISFTVKVNKKNVPFKSIQAKEIADKLKINAQWVKTSPLKKIGQHQVIVEVGDSKTKISVVIVPEK